MHIFPTILAGGFGARLHPLSTEEKPKQFHDLLGVGKTVLQQTYERALKISDANCTIIVANSRHKPLVEEQIADANCHKIYEPCSKNTAASIFITLPKILSLPIKAPASQRYIVVMPADHYIAGDFSADINRALALAKTGRIVTFGIKPTHANENYGYIMNHYFTEKPNKNKAEWLIENAGKWNSGIFVARADVLLQEFRALQPSFFKQDFNNFPALPFDRAIMEKTKRHVCLEAKFEWDDLGSWESLARYNPNLRYNASS